MERLAAAPSRERRGGGRCSGASSWRNSLALPPYRRRLSLRCSRAPAKPGLRAQLTARTAARAPIYSALHSSLRSRRNVRTAQATAKPAQVGPIPDLSPYCVTLVPLLRCARVVESRPTLAENSSPLVLAEAARFAPETKTTSSRGASPHPSAYAHNRSSRSLRRPYGFALCLAFAIRSPSAACPQPASA